jgi:hypothetical protein
MSRVVITLVQLYSIVIGNDQNILYALTTDIDEYHIACLAWYH